MNFEIMRTYVCLCRYLEVIPSWGGLSNYEKMVVGGTGRMGEFKWIKIDVNMFDDEKMKLIEVMPERDTINYIWIRLLQQAGKTNEAGYILLSRTIPYTEEMLSTIFNRPINSIRLGLSTLSNLGMINISSDNIIKIVNWEKHQNVASMEKVREQTRKRVSKHRNKEKDDEMPIPVTECNVTVTEQREREDKDTIYINIYSKNKSKREDINKQSIDLITHYEKVLGRVGVFNSGAIRLALEMYDYVYVKMAIDKAIEVGKVNMNYVNGILKNWVKEGYPKNNLIEDGGKFSGFKPNEPDIVSGEERRAAEKKLI